MGSHDPARGERDWLLRYEIRARKRLGQNFLLDPRVPELIVERAQLPAGEWVLEVGPGAGALTDALLRAGHPVVAVEKDPRLIPLLRERFALAIAEERLRLIEADVLEVEAGLLPPRATLLGNLPYVITTPILAWAASQRARFRAAIVMVQREVAERILAPPGGRVYGSLSVFIRAQAEVRSLLQVGRSTFWPRPGVESTVIELRFVEPPPWPGRIDALEQVLRAAFGQRRKTLENALSHGLGCSKAAARGALEAANCAADGRGETLRVDDFGRLTESLLARDLLRAPALRKKKGCAERATRSRRDGG